MKFSKTFSFLVYLILFTGLSRANPLFLFHINEIQIDSSGWKIELKNLNMGFISSLDSCYLTTFTDTVYFKSGIAIVDSFLVITQDSLIDSLNINRFGDIIGFHYIDGSPLDQLGFGNITGWSVVAAPYYHQSICLREYDNGNGQTAYYYLDNTPSFGYVNDELNAKGNVTGIITDSLGYPLSNVKVVYDRYYSLGMPIDIYVITDSIGKFILSDYARYNTLSIQKQNYQIQRVGLQIWPEDTVTINDTLYSVIDFIAQSPDFEPNKYKLSQNYPNPFNNSTVFTYTIPKNNFVEIAIFDISGKLVEKLFAGEQKPGEYKVYWNAEKVASGVYVYQIKTNDFIYHKKCLLIK